MISNMIFCLLLLIGVLGQSLAQTDSSTGQSINQPIINRISGCTDVGNITTDCPRVHQSILTIYGFGFMPIDASIKDYSMLLIQPSSRLSYRLTSINDTCITVAYQLYYGQFMNADPITVTIIYQSNEYVSADGLSYEPAQPLSLSRIDGCGVVSPDGLSASGCNYLNPIILIGSGFNTIAADSYRITFGSSIMSFVANDGMVVLNDSAISLQLSSIIMYSNAWTFIWTKPNSRRIAATKIYCSKTKHLTFKTESFPARRATKHILLLDASGRSSDFWC